MAEGQQAADGPAHGPLLHLAGERRRVQAGTEALPGVRRGSVHRHRGESQGKCPLHGTVGRAGV